MKAARRQHQSIRLCSTPGCHSQAHYDTSRYFGIRCEACLFKFSALMNEELDKLTGLGRYRWMRREIALFHQQGLRPWQVQVDEARDE